MSDNTMPFNNSEPTVEALAFFFQAYLEILESHYGIPLKQLSGRQAEELNNLLDATLLLHEDGPLYVRDKAGLRQLQSWFQQGMLP